MSIAALLWARLRHRVAFLLSYRERQQSLREEMEHHIREIAQHYLEQGMTPAAAHAAAKRKFGNMAQSFEDSHSIWLARWFSDFMQDLRFALRGMRRDAAFTAFAILITGLGIGAGSTIFSIVNAILLRPLPFADPGRLVWIANVEWSTQVSNFLDFRQRSRSFSDLAGWSGAYGVGDWQLTGTGEPERLTGVPVTQNLFALLGVAPALGRTFSTDECRQPRRAITAVMLSNAFWQRRFASDVRIVGSKLLLNNRPVTVVGVLPASFDFGAVFSPGSTTDIFIPWPLTEETNRMGNTMNIVGRLQPGASIAAAQTEFSQLAGQLQSEYPERNPVTPRLSSLAQRVNGRVRPALLVLAGAVGVVMLIVCANLSNLQLARLGTRQREMAMRLALGAGRSRLLRQMLTENIALSCAGALLGVCLALAGTHAVAHLYAFRLPLLTSVHLDAQALAFTLLSAVVTGVLFGLLPALQAPAFAVQESLKENSRGMSAGKRRAWLRNALMISEVAFAALLLVSTGLLVRSLVRVLDLDLGFEPGHTAVLRVDPGSRIAGLAQQDAFVDDMLQRARAIPGVRSAGLVDVLPFAGDRAWQVSGKGQIYPKGHTPEAYIRVVSDGYLQAAGIRLLSGRPFSEHDRSTGEPVVIVNQTLARTLWPGQNPLGQVMTQDGGRRVIGVAADVRHFALEDAAGSEMYLPLRQTRDYAALQLVVRSALPPEALAPALRTTLRTIDPNLPVRELQTLQALVDKAVSPRRFLVMLLGGFAAFALLLASLGIYAVISYSVQQRSQEIGIRLALGASPTALQQGILARTMALAAVGLAVGMLSAQALSSLLQSLLFGVTPGDLLTHAAVALMLAAVAALAGFFPARRASRIDPIAAMRSV